MSFDALGDWFEANKAWFVPSALMALAMIGGFVGWVISRRDRRKASPPDNTAAFIAQLIGGLEKVDQRVDELESQNKQLTKAFEGLATRKEAGEEPDRITEALKEANAGNTASAEAIFEQVLERLKAGGEDAYKEAAAAARHVGALAYLHDTQKAQSAYTQAVALDPEDPDGWNMLGILRDRAGDLDGAIAAYGRVLALGNKTGDKTAIAIALGNLGNVYFTHGKLGEAEEHHRKSLTISEELGRKEGMAIQYGNLGLIYRTRGDLEKAEEYHLKSLKIAKEQSHKAGMASQYGNLGLVYEARGESEKAEEHYLKALALNEELGRKEGMANQLGNLGNVYAKRRELEKAEEFYRKSLELNEELGRKEGMANQYGSLGNVYKTRGDLDKAEEHYLKSLALHKELGHKEGMANDYGNLGMVYGMRGELEKACDTWAESVRLFEELGAAGQAEKIRGWMDEAGCGREETGKEDGGG